ncbi:ras-related protein rab-7A [Histomonas meleagridis]|uniref:ras-related protein rab-7A n=1 Tax=Histomonas meleagridis TaxID=135588 RepID=UPI003559E516|nr:ras-related protein rab-7A [Histomonas meleagridis]KAH0799945.1 ras-related protein rab-7A [Histomonas meleagridis]
MVEKGELKEISLKLTLIGEHFVGKTSMIERFVNGTFDKSYQATIGFSFLSKTIELDGVKCTVNVWDTSGSERHRAVAPNYYRGTDGCILVYDVSNPQSVEPLSYWYEEFTSLVSLPNYDNIPILLIGNKADLPYEKSTYQDAQSFAETHHIEKHFLASALDGRNINEAFNELVKMCIGNQTIQFSSILMTNEPTEKRCC